MSLSNTVVNISSSKPERILGPARYFRVMNASADVRCRFVFENEMLEVTVPAGIGVPFVEPFKEVMVWGAGAAEDVEIMVHELVIHDSRFTASAPLVIANISSEVNIAELVGSRLASLGEIEPSSWDCEFWERFGTASTALQTIVSPASNVNGLVIVDAGIVQASSRMMFNQTAPTSATDVGAKTIVASFETSGKMSAVDRVGNVLIPAGMGLYYQSETASYADKAFCKWRLL